MKKIILLMSFIVLTTIAHAFNYNTITVYQDGEWSDPFYIKTSVVYNEARKTITFSNNKWGKMVLKITSSKRQGDMEYHMCIHERIHLLSFSYYTSRHFLNRRIL